MKKLGVLKRTFCTAALVLCMTLQAFAADAKISFSDPSAEASSEVNVTMKISAEGEAKLSNATVTLSYPAEKLEFVAGTDADGGAGTVRVHGASNGAGTGVLEYNLKFRTKEAGQAAVTVNTQEVYDDAGEPVNITHLGTSTITVNAGEAVSADAALAALEVSPGALEPAFSADVTDYQVKVGTSADRLSINALPNDSGANVILSGNEGLQIGENTVSIKVTAADGQTTREYLLTVLKEEGGEEPTEGAAETEESFTETEASGVQLSSKGKTITIMNPGSDVQIPEGFKPGTISIDGQRVQGWIWGADSDPKYCVVYGMNDQGELYFYRYDMAEKTIQRYFEDPLAANSVTNQEYTALSEQYNRLTEDYDLRFLIICILGLLSLILLASVIYLFARLRSLQRAESRERRQSPDRRSIPIEAEEDFDHYNESLLRHDFDPEEETEAPAMDETQILRRPQPRRRGRVSEETMVIPQPEDAALPEDEDVKLADGSKKDAAQEGANAEEDAFDTFDI